MAKVSIKTLEQQAKLLLLDIGGRYGTLTAHSDGSYDLVTYGEVHLHYQDALHGCDDWYEYIKMVMADARQAGDSPLPYEVHQMDTLEQIYNILHGAQCA